VWHSISITDVPFCYSPRVLKVTDHTLRQSQLQIRSHQNIWIQKRWGYNVQRVENLQFDIDISPSHEARRYYKHDSVDRVKVTRLLHSRWRHDRRTIITSVGGKKDTNSRGQTNDTTTTSGGEEMTLFLWHWVTIA